MANSLLAMGGMEGIPALGPLGIGVGAGYFGLAGFAELSGRSGVGEVLSDAKRSAGSLFGTTLFGFGAMVGRENEIAGSDVFSLFKDWAFSKSPEDYGLNQSDGERV